MPSTEFLSWLPGALPGPPVDALTRAEQASANGNMLCRQGRPAEAVQQYGEAVRLQPKDARYHLGLGIAAWRAGMIDLAGKHLQEVIRLMPDNAVGHEFIGQY